jgi:hypothetical protein
MGRLIDPTANLYRHTKDGRRVFGTVVLFGRAPKYYLVSDAAAKQLERLLRVYSALAFTTVVFLGPLVSLYGRLWLSLLIIPLTYAVGLHHWIRRNLPRAAVTSSDLVPIDRRARDLAEAQRIGEPMLWLLLAATIAMASLGVSIVVHDGAWWAWLGVLMFGSGAVVMFRGIRKVRRARRRTMSPPAA